MCLSDRLQYNPQRDNYYLENHISTLDGPGQYVLKERNGACRIWAWPFESRPAAQLVIEGVRRGGYLVDFTNKQHVVFDELEVCYSKGSGMGTRVTGSHDDINIECCYVHDNTGYGIGPRGGTRLLIRRCVVRGNSNAIVIGGVIDSTVEECDIGPNRGDGIVSAGGTRNLHIRRNYIHDHYLWGHPDGIQFWNDVENIWIENNGIFNSGQSIMSAGMKDVHLLNNIIVGARACSVILGGEGFELEGNTLFSSGLSIMNAYGRGYLLRNNIIVQNRDLTMFGIHDLKALDSDYNLLWASSGYDGCLVSVERKWPRGFEAYRRLGGLDKNSVHAPPGFIHAPAYVQAMDYKRVTKMTRAKFYTWGKRGDFAVGDRVHVDFDGPMRTVIEVGEDYLIVDPRLAKLPVKAGLIVNWKDAKDCQLDLLLLPASPARGAGEGGRDLGSSIDVRAYQRGDFNGDGVRDLPDNEWSKTPQ